MKRKGRNGIACAACAKSKRKCNGERPCDRCKERGIECVPGPAEIRKLQKRNQQQQELSAYAASIGLQRIQTDAGGPAIYTLASTADVTVQHQSLVPGTLHPNADVSGITASTSTRGAVPCASQDLTVSGASQSAAVNENFIAGRTQQTFSHGTSYSSSINAYSTHSIPHSSFNIPQHTAPYSHSITGGYTLVQNSEQIHSHAFTRSSDTNQQHSLQIRHPPDISNGPTGSAIQENVANDDLGSILSDDSLNFFRSIPQKNSGLKSDLFGSPSPKSMGDSRVGPIAYQRSIHSTSVDELGPSYPPRLSQIHSSDTYDMAHTTQSSTGQTMPPDSNPSTTSSKATEYIDQLVDAVSLLEVHLHSVNNALETGRAVTDQQPTSRINSASIASQSNGGDTSSLLNAQRSDDGNARDSDEEDGNSKALSAWRLTRASSERTQQSNIPAGNRNGLIVRGANASQPRHIGANRITRATSAIMKEMLLCANASIDTRTNNHHTSDQTVQHAQQDVQPILNFFPKLLRILNDLVIRPALARTDSQSGSTHSQSQDPPHLFDDDTDPRYDDLVESFLSGLSIPAMHLINDANSVVPISSFANDAAVQIFGMDVERIYEVIGKDGEHSFWHPEHALSRVLTGLRAILNDESSFRFHGKYMRLVPESEHGPSLRIATDIPGTEDDLLPPVMFLRPFEATEHVFVDRYSTNAHRSWTLLFTDIKYDQNAPVYPWRRAATATSVVRALTEQAQLFPEMRECMKQTNTSGALTAFVRFCIFRGVDPAGREPLRRVMFSSPAVGGLFADAMLERLNAIGYSTETIASSSLEEVPVPSYLFASLVQRRAQEKARSTSILNETTNNKNDAIIPANDLNKKHATSLASLSDVADMAYKDEETRVASGHATRLPVYGVRVGQKVLPGISSENLRFSGRRGTLPALENAERPRTTAFAAAFISADQITVRSSFN